MKKKRWKFVFMIIWDEFYFVEERVYGVWNIKWIYLQIFLRRPNFQQMKIQQASEGEK